MVSGFNVVRNRLISCAMYGVVDAPAGEVLGNVGPLVAQDAVVVEDDVVLAGRPRVAGDLRRQHVVPAVVC